MNHIKRIVGVIAAMAVVLGSTNSVPAAAGHGGARGGSGHAMGSAGSVHGGAASFHGGSARGVAVRGGFRGPNHAVVFHGHGFVGRGPFFRSRAFVRPVFVGNRVFVSSAFGPVWWWGIPSWSPGFVYFCPPTNLYFPATQLCPSQWMQFAPGF